MAQLQDTMNFSVSLKFNVQRENVVYFHFKIRKNRNFSFRRLSKVKCSWERK